MFEKINFIDQAELTADAPSPQKTFATIKLTMTLGMLGYNYMKLPHPYGDVIQSEPIDERQIKAETTARAG